MNVEIPKAEECKISSMNAIKRVMDGDRNRTYKKDYLRSSDSFFEVFSAMTSSGYNFSEKMAQNKFLDIFNKKMSLTTEDSAWNQYRDLANWLTYFLMSIDISNFYNKDKFLDIIFHSLNTMSEKLLLGYSWEAYEIWKQQWNDILESNKKLISDCYKNDKDKLVPFL